MKKTPFRVALGRILPSLSFILILIAAFFVSPSAQATAQTWINGFLRDANGYLEVNCTNCSGGSSGVSSVTAGNTTVTIGGTTANPTVAVNQASNFTLTGAVNLQGAFSANTILGLLGPTGTCSGAKIPATLYGLCVGANNGTGLSTGILMGPVATDFTCSASCTVGDSSRILFYESIASGAVNGCSEWFNESVGALEDSCAVMLAGRFITQTNGNGGSCTTSASTSCIVTTGHTFGAPICNGSESGLTAHGPVACNLSGTTMTLTINAAAGNYTLTGWAWGNGS